MIYTRKVRGQTRYLIWASGAGGPDLSRIPDGSFHTVAEIEAQIKAVNLLCNRPDVRGRGPRAAFDELWMRWNSGKHSGGIASLRKGVPGEGSSRKRG